PQERQIFEMKFPTFNNVLMNRFMRHGIITKISRACPHHGFTELHQLDTFYNALNPVDQDSLNSTADSNLLERRAQDVLMIIENKSKAWDRYKDLLRACPHHSFTELHQLDTFYNALNPTDQDSLNVAAGGNLLERSTQDVLKIIENKSKVRNSRSKPIASQVKACDVNSNSSEIAKLTHAVNQGAHPYYQCLAAGGNTFPKIRDNIQGYVTAAVVNYNQDNPGYRPPGLANQIRPPGFAQPNVQNNQNRFGPTQGFNRGNKQSYQAPAPQNQNVHLNELEKVKRMNEANMKAMQTQIDMVKNELRNEMKSSIQTSLSNQTNEIKNMMASLLQIKTASTSGSGSLLSNTVANPKGAITTRSEETFTNPDLAEYTIKVPPPPVQKYKPPSPREFVVHQRDPRYPNIPYPSRMLKQKQQEKDEVQIHKFWQMFKQLHINITLADALVLMPKTARALIKVHGEEMILRDGDERLTLNMKHDTASYSNHPQRESVNLINIFNVSSEDFLKVSVSKQSSDNPTFSLHPELTSLEVTHEIHDSEGCNGLFEKLPDIDSINDIHPHFDDNPLSGSTTYFSNSLLEGEKIKESKLLIDELDLPCDFHPPPEYDLFLS
nr:hypothetical protein [Tanacetum cinerariifolium]